MNKTFSTKGILHCMVGIGLLTLALWSVFQFDDTASTYSIVHALWSLARIILPLGLFEIVISWKALSYLKKGLHTLSLEYPSNTVLRNTRIKKYMLSAISLALVIVLFPTYSLLFNAFLEALNVSSPSSLGNRIIMVPLYIVGENWAHLDKFFLSTFLIATALLHARTQRKSFQTEQSTAEVTVHTPIPETEENQNNPATLQTSLSKGIFLMPLYALLGVYLIAVFLISPWFIIYLYSEESYGALGVIILAILATGGALIGLFRKMK